MPDESPTISEAKWKEGIAKLQTLIESIESNSPQSPELPGALDLNVKTILLDLGVPEFSGNSKHVKIFEALKKFGILNIYSNLGFERRDKFKLCFDYIKQSFEDLLQSCDSEEIDTNCICKKFSSIMGSFNQLMRNNQSDISSTFSLQDTRRDFFSYIISTLNFDKDGNLINETAKSQISRLICVLEYNISIMDRLGCQDLGVLNHIRSDFSYLQDIFIDFFTSSSVLVDPHYYKSQLEDGVCIDDAGFVKSFVQHIILNLDTEREVCEYLRAISNRNLPLKSIWICVLFLKNDEYSKECKTDVMSLLGFLPDNLLEYVIETFLEYSEEDQQNLVHELTVISKQEGLNEAIATKKYVEYLLKKESPSDRTGSNFDIDEERITIYSNALTNVRAEAVPECVKYFASDSKEEQKVSFIRLAQTDNAKGFLDTVRAEAVPECVKYFASDSTDEQKESFIRFATKYNVEGFLNTVRAEAVPECVKYFASDSKEEQKTAFIDFVADDNVAIFLNNVRAEAVSECVKYFASDSKEEQKESFIKFAKKYNAKGFLNTTNKIAAANCCSFLADGKFKPDTKNRIINLLSMLPDEYKDVVKSNLPKLNAQKLGALLHIESYLTTRSNNKKNGKIKQYTCHSFFGLVASQERSYQSKSTACALLTLSVLGCDSIGNDQKNFIGSVAKKGSNFMECVRNVNGQPGIGMQLDDIISQSSCCF